MLLISLQKKRNQTRLKLLRNNKAINTSRQNFVLTFIGAKVKHQSQSLAPVKWIKKTGSRNILRGIWRESPSYRYKMSKFYMKEYITVNIYYEWDYV